MQTSSRMKRWPGTILLLAWVLAPAATGCAGRRAPATPSEEAPRAAAPSPLDAGMVPPVLLEEPEPVCDPAPPAAPGPVYDIAAAVQEGPTCEAGPAAPAVEEDAVLAAQAAPEPAPATGSSLWISESPEMPFGARPAPAQVGAAPSKPRPSLRELCRQPKGASFMDESRRLLEETFCGATLWFDGLFGGEPDLQNARAVSGRVELSSLYTEYEGADYHGRLRLNYDLPNLERRVRLFLGREDEEDFIADRENVFAVRSSVFGLETEEEWLAGLGYRPPGRWLSKTDFRLGGRVKSAPEVFLQWRYRQNVFAGQRTVWRLRETFFYENRDGFGSTTSIDVDHVIRRDVLTRWANVGTYSEETEGLEWRSAGVLYKNLPGRRAVAGELFVRGATDAEVPLREYGSRFVYRQPLGRPYLFGEIIVGYSWPREELTEPRDGSAMIGFGLDLLFGQFPW